MSTFFVSVLRTFPGLEILVRNSRPFLKCFFLRPTLFFDVTQLWLIASYRHFGTPYHSHLQGSSSPRRPLKMGRRLYRNVGNYPPTTLRNIPESGFGGLGVSVLASGTRFRGFKPGRSRRIFKGGKILSTHSFGREVKPWVPCRRFAACKRSLKCTVEVGILG
jgi:hypothetical protein